MWDRKTQSHPVEVVSPRHRGWRSSSSSSSLNLHWNSPLPAEHSLKTRELAEFRQALTAAAAAAAASKPAAGFKARTRSSSSFLANGSLSSLSPSKRKIEWRERNFASSIFRTKLSGWIKRNPVDSACSRSSSSAEAGCSGEAVCWKETFLPLSSFKSQQKHRRKRERARKTETEKWDSN